MNTMEQQVASLPRVDPELVYIVDDETMIGGFVQVILQRSGYKPRFFQNPELALRALVEEDTKPALLLTDFVMEPFNGMELIKRCKQHLPNLRTLLYSGNTCEDVVQQYPVPPDGFLLKPFLPNALLGMVRHTLDVGV
jgi:DNA-binding NtrC family response regulator